MQSLCRNSFRLKGVVMVRNVFVVVSSSREEVFWESVEGALVFFHSVTRERNGPPVLFQTDSLCLPPSFSVLDRDGPLHFQELPYVDLNRKAPLYEIKQSWPVIVYVAVSTGMAITKNPLGIDIKKMVSSQVLEFFLRYRVFREVMDSGDFLTAAHMLVHSRKLRPFLNLLKHLEGSQSNLPIIWYYLHDQGETKQKSIQNYLQKKVDRVSSDYLRLFQVASSLCDCSGVLEFERESLIFIRQCIAVDGLWVPVVGLPFHQQALSRYIKEFEKLDSHLVGEMVTKSLEPAQHHRRCTALMQKLLPIRIVFDFASSQDPQAMAVYGTTLQGGLLHFGFIKSELALILSGEDYNHSVTVALLEEENLEVIIRRNHD
jgi:hypothetical protein